jgi:trans-aconitate methyltransferase
LDQQTKGLEHISFLGRTVLELGCAEGLMSKWMIDRGAASVTGIDVRSDFIEEARRQCAGLPCHFRVLDLNEEFPVWGRYDIVMALAVLHKLRMPSVVAGTFAHAAGQTLVVRLPPKGAPYVTDPRSGNVPHNVETTILARGLKRAEVTEGPYAEWTATYRRP